MNVRKVTQGALLGAAGGMAMAMWSMIALAATGDGFFAPVNFIAHSLWRDAPLDGGFSGAAFVLGIVIHMMVSMMLGVMIVIATDRRSMSTAGAVAVSIGVPMAAWAGQLVAWDAIDSDARSLFTPWVLFVGHAVFAMVAAGWTILVRRQTTPAASGPLRNHAHAHA
ncbi:MAG: hypothetical protein AB7L17_16300 [Ilumatobacteraceae bacterium]